MFKKSSFLNIYFQRDYVDKSEYMCTNNRINKYIYFFENYTTGFSLRIMAKFFLIKRRITVTIKNDLYCMNSLS